MSKHKTSRKKPFLDKHGFCRNDTTALDQRSVKVLRELLETYMTEGANLGEANYVVFGCLEQAAEQIRMDSIDRSEFARKAPWQSKLNK